MKYISMNQNCTHMKHPFHPKDLHSSIFVNLNPDK